MSKLTIKFLINYDLDNLNIFTKFDCWDWLYLILENNIDEMEDDRKDSENILLISIGRVIRR